MAPQIDADLRVTRGRDVFRVRASGTRVVVSTRNPLAAWRLRRLKPAFETRLPGLRRAGIGLEVRCLGIPIFVSPEGDS